MSPSVRAGSPPCFPQDARPRRGSARRCPRAAPASRSLASPACRRRSMKPPRGERSRPAKRATATGSTRGGEAGSGGGPLFASTGAVLASAVRGASTGLTASTGTPMSPLEVATPGRIETRRILPVVLQQVEGEHVVAPEVRNERVEERLAGHGGREVYGRRSTLAKQRRRKENSCSGDRATCDLHSRGAL